MVGTQYLIQSVSHQVRVDSDSQRIASKPDKEAIPEAQVVFQLQAVSESRPCKAQHRCLSVLRAGLLPHLLFCEDAVNSMIRVSQGGRVPSRRSITIGVDLSSPLMRGLCSLISSPVCDAHCLFPCLIPNLPVELTTTLSSKTD